MCGSLFVSTAYQRRTCGVSRESMAYVLHVRMCHVRFAAVWFERHIRGNMNILWRAKRILMLLYKCFRFSDASHGSRCRAGFIQGYAWFSLCLCSCRLTTRMGSLEMVLSPPSPRVFSSVLI